MRRMGLFVLHADRHPLWTRRLSSGNLRPAVRQYRCQHMDRRRLQCQRDDVGCPSGEAAQVESAWHRRNAYMLGVEKVCSSPPSHQSVGDSSKWPVRVHCRAVSCHSATVYPAGSTLIMLFREMATPVPSSSKVGPGQRLFVWVLAAGNGLCVVHAVIRSVASRPSLVSAMSF